MDDRDHVAAAEYRQTDESPPRRWQFSLAALMIAMSVICVLLAFRFLIDRRTIAFVAVATIVMISEGKATRSTAIGALIGICFGLAGWDRHWWDGNEPTDDVFTIVTLGACAAWFAAALQIARRGNKAGFVALLALFVWLPFWLAAMR